MNDFKSKIISYFNQNHLFTNFLFVLILISGIYAWQVTQKEDLPNIEFDTLRISVNYVGASPEEVEYFITAPLEDALKSVSGIEDINSTSSKGSSSIRLDLKSTDSLEQQTTINEIKDAVNGVSLPADAKTPKVRQFKTANKSILEIALFHPSAKIMDFAERNSLQQAALSLENQLTILPEVNDIGKTGYLKLETQINLIPEKLAEYNLTFNTVASLLDKYDLRLPLGSLSDQAESEIVLSSTDYRLSSLSNVVVRGNVFQPTITLGQIANITRKFPKNNSIIKVNGREAIVLRVTKASDVGILSAMEAVTRVTDNFEIQQKINNIKVVRLDDEAQVVEDRINLIKENGIIGFFIILIFLLIFLDFRSSIWVAMGIPFTFTFTMILVYYTGLTINNITMAGIIMVMGMVVDDAVVIAENIVRYKNQGLSAMEASVKGTSEMILPVAASTLTTCIAFIPLFQMDGRWASLVIGIPIMVMFMLGASLFESLVILPGHMSLPRLKIINWFSQKFGRTSSNSIDTHPLPVSKPKPKRQWFNHVENYYGKQLTRLLSVSYGRYSTIIIFILFLLGTIYYGKNNLKFVMFPNEETTQVNLTGTAPPNTTRYVTAALSEQLDTIFTPYLGKEILGYRTEVAKTRRGNTAKENVFRTEIELLPLDQRSKPLNTLLAEFDEAFTQVTNLEIKTSKQRFGRSSGSPIEVIILDNHEETRLAVSRELQEIMKKDPELYNVEEKPVIKKEGYEITVKQNLINQLKTSISEILNTLNSALTSKTIGEIVLNGEKTDLKLGLSSHNKTNIQQLLNLSIKDQLEINEVVSLKPTQIAQTIDRENYKRVSTLYADTEPSSQRKRSSKRRSNGSSKNSTKNKNDNPNKNSSAQKRDKQKNLQSPTKKSDKSISNPTKTPLEVAERYEQTVFPALLAKYPSTTIYFDGEVKESRESTNQFTFILLVVLFLIYFVLALLFQSLAKPFVVMLIIPFGLVGVVFAYYLHGISLFGFFAVLGFLGLTGVIINDTIVMTSKLDQQKKYFNHENLGKQIAEVAKTRLKAILITTLTTVAGLFPSIYGWAGYDSLLAEMMFVIAWGLLFGTIVTLVLVPLLYYFIVKMTLPKELKQKI